MDISKKYSVIIAFLAMSLQTACGGGGNPPAPTAGDTADNPIIVEALDLYTFQYEGEVGTNQLYIKVINLAVNNGIYNTELSRLADDADMYTYSDAYMNETCASNNTGTVFESCDLDSNSNGEIYIKIDGSKTSAGTSFLLYGAD